MKRILLVTLLVALLLPVLASSQDIKVTSRLDRRLIDDAPLTDGRVGIWIYFTDKALSGSEFDTALRRVEQDLPQRTLDRRAKMRQPGQRLVDGMDLPLAEAYLEAVAATGARARKHSRWLNAASFDATPEQIDAIAALPYVKKVDLVAQFFRPEIPTSDSELDLADKSNSEAETVADWNFNYGVTLSTMEQINVPAVHDMGLTGDGVIIAMLDAGFRTVHPVFDNLDIIDQWDFVNDDPIVDWEEGDGTYQARHGTQTLSSVVGFKNGEYVAPAFGASVILAMTEEVVDELPIEEDFWVAGLEWAESLGADIISSSLGYYYWYDFIDLDGNTAVTTVAADMAVERGLLVVTSAGNERDNPDHPHMTAPADGDSVIAAGAVSLSGAIASFSSPGPTYDGRIKPDVSAQGLSNRVASYYDDVSYNAVDGTSFACPLIAGVGALLLERVPELDPIQIREALWMTADRAGNPDNDYGYGIVDAAAALAYWGPSVAHTPLTDTEDAVGPYTVTADITDRNPLDPSNMDLFYRFDGGPWTTVPLATMGGDTYSADIPGQPGGGTLEYYLRVGDTIGITVNAPLLAPDQNYTFQVGADTVAPLLIHAGTVDQTLATWPPTLNATATDNIGVDRVELDFTHNGGASQGPFPLVPLGGDIYSLDFPLTVGEVSEGDVLFYTITAWDVAGVSNSTVNGPYEIRVVDNLGHILVINDADLSAKDSGDKNSATDLALWLAEAGYIVDEIDAGEVLSGSFEGYDALVLACGGNPSPLDFEVMREDMIAWVRDHGKILIEGGNVTAWAIGEWTELYPEFAREVLHADLYWGSPYFDWTIQQATGYSDHPFLNRPFLVPNQLTIEGFEYNLTAVDYVYVTEDALPLMRTLANTNTGGVVVHDDNTAPEAGQTVYFTWDMTWMDPAQGRELTENAMAYLMAREAPGTGSISGTVRAVSGDPLPGVTVSSSTGESAVSGPDGNYTLTGLHGTYYNLIATLENHGPVETRVELAESQSVDNVDFMLREVVQVQALRSPEIPIPDFNPEGVSDVITITDAGSLFDLSIDINIDHASKGHLTVVLTNPQGTSVTLHNRTGGIEDDIVGNWDENLTVDGPGSLSDFAGQEVQGDWTMTVADHQFGATGTFRVWQLNLLIGVPGVSASPENNLPQATRLVGNVPNPFNPQTVVAFDLAQPGRVELEIFDVRGHLVKRLVSADLPAGQYRETWQGRDESGRAVASGVYFARLNAAGVTDLNKMMLVR